MLLVPIFQPEEFNGKLYTEYGYVLKQFAKYMTEIERLQVDLEKTHNQLVEVEKESQERIAKLEKELEEWKEEARVVKKQRDEQLKSFRKGIEPYVDLLHMHETIAELKQHIDELKSKNESLNQSINEITTSRSEWIDKAVEWQQKCEKLESKETETCEKKPKTSDSTPSMEWYENRHQSDCIEINRLNTAIDVLIHKVEYLRQFAGLE